MRLVSMTLPLRMAKAMAVSHNVEVTDVAMAAAVPGRSCVAEANEM